MRMPAISLWQPWASLYLTPAKPDETRHWALPRDMVGRVVAVHAAKRPFKVADLEPEFVEVCDQFLQPGWQTGLPKGAFIGTVRLSTCRQMTTGSMAEAGSLENFICGNWESGRFAWRGDDKAAFSNPIPAIGRQGFFSADEALKDTALAAAAERRAAQGTLL